MERQQELYTRQYGTRNEQIQKHEQLPGDKLTQGCGYGIAEGDRVQKLGVYGWKREGGHDGETQGAREGHEGGTRGPDEGHERGHEEDTMGERKGHERARRGARRGNEGGTRRARRTREGARGGQEGGTEADYTGEHAI